MGHSTFETIDELLSSVTAELDDPELQYKLRTAHQLLHRIETEYFESREIFTDIDLDDEMKERLTKLGYLPSDT